MVLNVSVLSFFQYFNKDSRERVYERTINLLLRKVKPDFAWPRLQKDEAKVSLCVCVCVKFQKITTFAKKKITTLSLGPQV